ncbi:MAG: IS30 family transposase [Pseudomonadota bacterium]
MSREVNRTACDSGACSPQVAEGSYMLRRRRPARLETDRRPARYATDRLTEGWTPERIAGRLRLGIKRGLAAVSAETIHAWIGRAARKPLDFWRTRPRRRNRRQPVVARTSRDTSSEMVHVSERSGAADARVEAGHWERDLILCRNVRAVPVLQEREPRLTLMARLAGKTAADTVGQLMAILMRLSPEMRGSITFPSRHVLRT